MRETERKRRQRDLMRIMKKTPTALESPPQKKRQSLSAIINRTKQALPSLAKKKSALEKRLPDTII